MAALIDAVSRSSPRSPCYLLFTCLISPSGGVRRVALRCGPGTIFSPAAGDCVPDTTGLAQRAQCAVTYEEVLVSPGFLRNHV